MNASLSCTPCSSRPGARLPHTTPQTCKVHPFPGRFIPSKGEPRANTGGDWLCAFPRGLTDRHRTPTRRWGRAQGTALRVEQQRGTDRVLRHSSDLTDALPFSHFPFGFLQKLLMYYHQQLLLLPPLAPWILKDI